MERIINLGEYPLHQPGSDTWQSLVDRCKHDLARDGMFNLTGFLKPDVARGVASTLTPAFASEAFLHERKHNIFFGSVDGLPDDHPALTPMLTSNRTLCADQLAETPLAALYNWPEFARFLAATMDKPVLYPMDDPLAGVNTMSYGERQALNWHFDRSEFTTTLLLQAPEAGGVFEYRPGLRTEAGPDYDGVTRLVTGQDRKVRHLSLSAGTLNVFRGRNTAHRVTPVSGNTARIIAVFSYFETPGRVFTEAERIGFYGRSE